MSFLPLRRWQRALLLFSSIFAFSVFIQFTVGWYQRRASTQDHLIRWEKEIEKDLLYTNRWDLKRYRQATPDAAHYYVFDSGGLVIDLEGFVPQFGVKVDLRNESPGIHTVDVSETNESWRLFISRVEGGLVFVGVSPPDDITNTDERLEETAKRFGTSLTEALLVNSSDIDKNIDYAVVRDDGTVGYAAGAIPLKAVSTPPIVQNKLTEIKDNEKSYGVLASPVRDKSGHEVGSLMVFDELPPKPWLSLQNWITNLLSSALLALVGTLVSVPYLGNEFRPKKLLQAALTTGESETVEFKESLRWDQPQGAPLSASELIAVRAVTAMLNNQDGGTVFIGIADDKRIVGLERDYDSLASSKENRGNPDKDRDRFQVHLRQLLSHRIGGDITKLHVELTIVAAENNEDVCVVHAFPSSTPVYISDAKEKAFYIRQGASTVRLDVEMAVKYIEKRWPKGLRRRLWNAIRMLRS